MEDGTGLNNAALEVHKVMAGGAASLALDEVSTNSSDTAAADRTTTAAASPPLEAPPEPPPTEPPPNQPVPSLPAGVEEEEGLEGGRGAGGGRNYGNGGGSRLCEKAAVPESAEYVEPPPGLGCMKEKTQAQAQSPLGELAVPQGDIGGKGSSPNNTMQVTSLPAEDWKRFFAPEFGGTTQLGYWNEGEPAVVRPGSCMPGVQLPDLLNEDRPTALGQQGLQDPDSMNLASQQDLLCAENARLAMENAMLRSNNMQLAWSAATGGADTAASVTGMSPEDMAAATAYWQGRRGSFSAMEEDAPPIAGGALPFFPNMWCPMMPMPGSMGGMAPWGWGPQGAAPEAAAGRGGAHGRGGGGGGSSSGGGTRARTDSDLPTRIRSLDASTPRARTFSANDVTDADELAAGSESGTSTTVMLRNLPNNYSRAMLLKLLDGEGFGGQYDFVYLPMDFKSHASLGYAFVNLLSSETAARLWEAFEGFNRWVVPSQKVCSVSWSRPYQGITAHTERYRNSPVMHEDVPPEYKPMVFQDGKPVPFPPPTKKLRAPRLQWANPETPLPEVAEGEG